MIGRDAEKAVTAMGFDSLLASHQQWVVRARERNPVQDDEAQCAAHRAKGAQQKDWRTTWKATSASLAVNYGRAVSEQKMSSRPRLALFQELGRPTLKGWQLARLVAVPVEARTWAKNSVDCS